MNWPIAESYKEAFEALGSGNDGNEAIVVHSTYQGNERSFSIFAKALTRNIGSQRFIAEEKFIQLQLQQSFTTGTNCKQSNCEQT